MLATANDCKVTLEGREWDFICDALRGIGNLLSHLDGYADSDSGFRCDRGEEIYSSKLAEKIAEQLK